MTLSTVRHLKIKENEAGKGFVRKLIKFEGEIQL